MFACKGFVFSGRDNDHGFIAPADALRPYPQRSGDQLTEPILSIGKLPFHGDLFLARLSSLILVEIVQKCKLRRDLSGIAGHPR